MVNKRKGFREDEAFKMFLSKNRIPEECKLHIFYLRQIFDAGSFYGKTRQELKTLQSDKRLAEFINKSKYVDRVLEAEEKIADFDIEAS